MAEDETKADANAQKINPDEVAQQVKDAVESVLSSVRSQADIEQFSKHGGHDGGLPTQAEWQKFFSESMIGLQYAGQFSEAKQKAIVFILSTLPQDQLLALADSKNANKFVVDTAKGMIDSTNSIGSTISQTLNELGGNINSDNVVAYQEKIFAKLRDKGLRNLNWDTVAKGIDIFLKLKLTALSVVPAEQRAKADLLKAEIESLPLNKQKELYDLMEKHGKKSLTDALLDKNFTDELPTKVSKLVADAAINYVASIAQSQSAAADAAAKTFEYKKMVAKKLREKFGDDGVDLLIKHAESQKGLEGLFDELPDMPQTERQAVIADWNAQIQAKNTALAVPKNEVTAVINKMVLAALKGLANGKGSGPTFGEINDMYADIVSALVPDSPLARVSGRGQEYKSLLQESIAEVEKEKAANSGFPKPKPDTSPVPTPS
jgi:hypothetical protein